MIPNTHPQTLCVKKADDFEVSGTGSSPLWGKTKWIPLKRVKGEAAYETRFKILYSNKGIYCLYFCEDSKITSTLKKDFTDLFNEDVVEAFFWPDESCPVYFEYELSPYNFELPILVPNNNGDFYGWLPWHYEGDRKTRHATQIVEEGKPKSWTAEFFVPFELLKPLQNVPPKKGTRWRANFYRIDYDFEPTYYSWEPIDQHFHEFEKFGVIEFD